jgi:hypothetical protein
LKALAALRKGGVESLPAAPKLFLNCGGVSGRTQSVVQPHLMVVIGMEYSYTYMAKTHEQGSEDRWNVLTETFIDLTEAGTLVVTTIETPIGFLVISNIYRNIRINEVTKK